MATPRARPQAIRLTDAAAERIKYVMANALQPIVGVRVGVKNGGCAGMTYTMEYAERIEAADEVVEDKAAANRSSSSRRRKRTRSRRPLGSAALATSARPRESGDPDPQSRRAALDSQHKRVHARP